MNSQSQSVETIRFRHPDGSIGTLPKHMTLVEAKEALRKDGLAITGVITEGLFATRSLH